ncbi:hypothetical protein C8Q79DRAFT_929621 [Trametes meyenii]|nr:hypothetical protein C8Q79DRAFT_929621 [Trametes meyenii]
MTPVAAEVPAANAAHQVPTVLGRASQRSQETTRAAAPFNREDADIVIRSSDNVEFHVHRIILSLASPVFAAMLTLPQPPGDNPTRPVVDVSEDSETFGIFLQMCYPLEEPRLTSFPLIRKVLACAVKYEAPRVLSSMKIALTRPGLLEEDPLRVFALACYFGLEEEAALAAEKAVIDERVLGAECAELNDISAAAYHRLLKLHRTRAVKDDAKHRGLRCIVVDHTDVGPFCEQANPPRAPRPQLESASHPFGLPDADVIIRSGDLVDSHVSRSILMLASPSGGILEKALRVTDGAVPVTPNEDCPDQHRGLPVYSIREDSVTIDALLRMCYATDHGHIHDLDVYLDVLTAARKYQVPKAERIMRAIFPSLVDQAPLRLYFAATECGWVEEARMSAKQLLQVHDIPSIYRQYLPEMETVLNGPYYRLLNYVEACSSAATATHVLSTGKHSSLSCDGRYPSEFSTDENLSWNNSFRFSSFKNALRDRPSSSTLSANAPLAREFVDAVMEGLPKEHSDYHSNGGGYQRSKKSILECGSSTITEWMWAVLDCYSAAVDLAVEKVELEVV